jgi:hypothetical protein
MCTAEQMRVDRECPEVNGRKGGREEGYYLCIIQHLNTTVK